MEGKEKEGMTVMRGELGEKKKKKGEKEGKKEKGWNGNVCLAREKRHDGRNELGKKIIKKLVSFALIFFLYKNEKLLNK